jgi:hypothetical protein
MGVTLPIIIIVYVNISFTIKAQEQEMYFQKIINIAVQDAANEMKEVENSDASIDYGYSGAEDKKVSVNSQVAVDAFLNSLYNNFGINGNETAKHYLQLFVPAIAIIDYDGVQVSSIESYKEINISGVTTDVTKHALKPKSYYSYTYSIVRRGGVLEMVDGNNTGGATLLSTHTVDFSMDDYITHRGVDYSSGTKILETKSFYIEDATLNYMNVKNNADLYASAPESFSETVVKKLLEQKQNTIVNTVIREMGYAINANNSYAKSAGIQYTFTFPPVSSEDLNNSVENIGMLAFVQGLSIGNKYLNTKAYGLSKLELATRFYLTVPNALDSKYKMNLYHKDINCPEYNAANKNSIAPRYLLTKQQASIARVTFKDLAGVTHETAGFYPCPICNP